MAYLTVVFERAVPPDVRARLLADVGYPAMPDESEADAYCVEVPDNEQWELAHVLANMEYGDAQPAVSRVSYARFRSDAEK